MQAQCAVFLDVGVLPEHGKKPELSTERTLDSAGIEPKRIMHSHPCSREEGLRLGLK